MSIDPPKPDQESDDKMLRRAVEAGGTESAAQLPPETQTSQGKAARPAAGRGVKDQIDSTKPVVRSAALPETIAGYRVLSVLGEGGMGVVYLVEQAKPIRRRVALKLIKPGMDSKAVIARFESERQALALMDHPGVAKVFDAGTTEQGRPYFAMEYVAGVPITEHCDRQKLSVKERLELFMQVCEAVQHAHQKGVIHRDIKPKNILVSVKEGQAVAKVIDFGVAKAISQPLTKKTLFTEQGQLIGTPSYMSPEQAEMTAQDIDTRTDIYSLGVVLYELLTGELPLDPKSLREIAFEQILRMIREFEPSKPSTRVGSTVRTGEQSEPRAQATGLPTPRLRSGLGSAVDVARTRGTDPKTLTRYLRGDLDWITMKALEKDRTRRYATASEFAGDIARHLKNEPVRAGPPSAGYRLSKFLRRNKRRIGTVGAVSIALLLAALGFVQASRERERAASGDVQAYLHWLDKNPAKPPKLGGHEHAIEAIVDRIRSGEASALDYQAFVKTFLTVEFSGRQGLIDARDASMVTGKVVVLAVSLLPEGLGLLVSGRVLLDGEPFTGAPWSEEEVIPLSTIVRSTYRSPNEPTSVMVATLDDFLDGIPLGTHRLDGDVHVQIIESNTNFANYRCLPQATVEVPVTPFSFTLIDEYPENYRPMITNEEWARQLDEGFELKISPWDSRGELYVQASFPKPRMNLACEVTLWSTEFEWEATFSLAAWSERNRSRPGGQ